MVSAERCPSQMFTSNAQLARHQLSGQIDWTWRSDRLACMFSRSKPPLSNLSKQLVAGRGSLRCEACRQEEAGPIDIFSDVQSVRWQFPAPRKGTYKGVLWSDSWKMLQRAEVNSFFLFNFKQWRQFIHYVNNNCFHFGKSTIKIMQKRQQSKNNITPQRRLIWKNCIYIVSTSLFSQHVWVQKERDKYKDLDVGGRIILKFILEKLGGMVWFGFIWLRIGAHGRLLWKR
jgi:hypothetical protein